MDGWLASTSTRNEDELAGVVVFRGVLLAGVEGERPIAQNVVGAPAEEARAAEFEVVDALGPDQPAVAGGAELVPVGLGLVEDRDVGVDLRGVGRRLRGFGCGIRGGRDRWIDLKRSVSLLSGRGDEPPPRRSARSAGSWTSGRPRSPARSCRPSPSPPSGSATLPTVSCTAPSITAPSAGASSGGVAGSSFWLPAPISSTFTSPGDGLG